MWAVPAKPVLASAVAVAIFAGALLISSILRAGDYALICPLSLLPVSAALSISGGVRGGEAVTSQLKSALIHYATTTAVPQQSRDEIGITYAVLRRRGPCNFLVFGLGLDSPMWAALNAGGTTIFLEEDMEWYRKVLQSSPELRAHHVKYRTRLDEADKLLKGWQTEPACAPGAKRLKGNERCRLALDALPTEIYEREWDMIMIDAPKGYYAAAPGRMAAIYSAATMARGRKGQGNTDVFLHDVDRPVEKKFGMKLLCKKYQVAGAGRLWHFEIPPASRTNQTIPTDGFC